MSKLVKVGVVGVDSGQVMICDPCYVDSEWKKGEPTDDAVLPDIWKDKNTGKTYAYAGFKVPEGMTVDATFETWEAPMDDYQGATPNTVRESGSWEKVEIPDELTRRGEFSYPGVCHTTLSKPGFGQLKYAMGHDGAGVVSRTLIGDGCYPVFARLNDEGSVEGLAVDFRITDYDGELKPEDVIAILSDPGMTDDKGMPRSAGEVREMLMERGDVSIWPALRRLSEGAEMIEKFLDHMREPIPGVEDLQTTVVESAESAIKAIHTMRSTMETIRKKIEMEDKEAPPPALLNDEVKDA